MDDLGLLKELPGRVDPPDEASKERMRALLEARTAPGRSRRRRGMKVGVLGIAAVLAAASLAAATAVHPWTADDPVAVQGISNPNGAILSRADLEAVVAEFAPAIRLPEGGSFDVWVQRRESIPEGPGGEASSMIGSGLIRAYVVKDMVFVAQCQWGQRWLDADAEGDRTGTAQALRVLRGIDEWFRSNAPEDDYGTSYFLDPMERGDRVGVQSIENICGYTGSWGTTPAEQDATAKVRLLAALETVQRYLLRGGDPAAFDPATAGDLTSDIEWTDSQQQPAPASPGYVFIGPSAGASVSLVAVSESGTQFCAVITDGSVERGTTIDDLSTTTEGGGGPHAVHPGPVTCTGGSW